MAKLNAGRFAAVFAANSELDFWSRLSSEVAGNFHQASDALLINRSKWICIDNVDLCVRRKETAGVVPPHSKRGLSAIVRAEAEELGITRNLVRHTACARDADHRAKWLP